MEKLFSKLAEAAQIKAAMAKQEVEFWNKIAEAMDDVSESRNTFYQAREEAPEPKEEPVKTYDRNACLTSNEAAKYLGLAPQTLSVWRVHGRGPKFRKVGRLVRYKLEDLEAYVNENTFPHTTAYAARR